ncbi:MAG: membrane protein insertion efficiency factor YidD [Epsilonproteobacteria bacterium]|nr:membrane protein insertion efficiency factor YidD [Campylobacterota bacterium]NPA65151.1 membrane protein insertion efficiency factor YidD [Campylobacterota bacterium]
MIRRVVLWILKIYQKIFTLLSYGSCRYYPTCSEYTKWRVEQQSLGSALFWSLVRVARCNQLFAGGIDYPIVSKKLSDIQFKKIDVRFWLVPKGQGKFFLIKNFKG